MLITNKKWKVSVKGDIRIFSPYVEIIILTWMRSWMSSSDGVYFNLCLSPRVTSEKLPRTSSLILLQSSYKNIFKMYSANVKGHRFLVIKHKYPEFMVFIYSLHSLKC